MTRSFCFFRRTLPLLAGLGALLAAGRAEALSVALEAAPGTCVAQPGEVYAQLTSLLVARGHTVTTVSATQIDTSAEIDAYDVVVFGGGNFTCEWDWLGFDAVLPGYVQGGGGLVVTGWGLYYLSSNTKGEAYPGLEATLPMLKGTEYLPAGTVSATPGHPITQGVTSFGVADYNNHGGGLRAGATPLLTQDGMVTGGAWEQGNGRSVYLGPIYLADWGNYLNEPLLNGSQPDAQTLLLQAIEWAGGGVPVDGDGDGVVDSGDNCPATPNPTQLDSDADGQGDACDADDDNDGVLDVTDNCALFMNADQLDSDGDAQGDACDTDDDNDGVLDVGDNCPLVMNADQLDTDGDGLGDACDTDDDGDGNPDAGDPCPLDPDPCDGTGGSAGAGGAQGGTGGAGGAQGGTGGAGGAQGGTGGTGGTGGAGGAQGGAGGAGGTGGAQGGAGGAGGTGGEQGGTGGGGGAGGESGGCGCRLSGPSADGGLVFALGLLLLARRRRGARAKGGPSTEV